MRNKRGLQLISIFLTLALTWTNGQAAQTLGLFGQSLAPNLAIPHVVQPKDNPSYFTQQAIVQHLVTPHFARPSLGGLYERWRPTESIGRLITPLAFVGAVVSSAALPLSTVGATEILTHTMVWALMAHGLYVGILKAVYGARVRIQPQGLLCGVDGYSVTLTPEQREIPWLGHSIPKEVADLSLAQGEVTTKRGMHEAGAVIRVQYEERGRTHYAFILAKVVNPKRDYLPVLLEREIRRQTTLAHLRDRGIRFPKRLVVIKHFRYSTSSDPSIEEEAHPHVGEVARDATVYAYENGRRVKSVTNVHIALTHNGDYDWIVLEDGEKVNADEEYKRDLIMTLRDPAHPQTVHPNTALGGDTPLWAMEVAVRRAKGDAYAALRFGRRSIATRDQRKAPPSPDKLKQWQAIFERVIDTTLPPEQDFNALSPADVQRVHAALVEAFSAAARQSPELVEDLMAGQLDAMLSAALDAFLHNDLFKVMQDISTRAATTFGAGVLSTVDEDPVFFSKVQGFAIARNGGAGWNSEPRALTVQSLSAGNANRAGGPVEEWAYHERLDLDSQNGEVVRLRADHAADIYSCLEKRVLTPDESEARWFDMTQSPFTAPMRRRASNKDGALNDLDNAAHWLHEADRVWANPNSYNRIATRHIGKRLLEQARLARENRLGIRSHVIVVGTHLELAHATGWVEEMQRRMPGLTFTAVDSNDVLLDKESFVRKYGIAPPEDDENDQTTVLVLDYFGGRFQTGQTVGPWLTRKVRHVFAITGGEEGDLDNNLARALGQKMRPGSKLAGNVITTCSPWPETQADSLSVHNFYATLNYMTLYLFDQYREAYPDNGDNRRTNPLKLDMTKDDIAEALAWQRQMASEAAQVTHVDSDGRVIASDTYDQIIPLATTLAQEYREPRVMRYAYRFVFLTGSLAIGLGFGIGPQSLFNGMTAGPAHVLLGLAASVVWYAGGDKGMVALQRAWQRRQVLSRLGIRITGIATTGKTWYFLENYWGYLFGLSYPDAATIAMGGNTVGGLDQFLTRIKKYLSRSSWVVNITSDDRLAPLKSRVYAARMTGNQVGVEVSGPGWVRRVNTVLKPFSLRIPFAKTQRISIGRHWPASRNAENYRITLPTTVFPLIGPLERFVNAFYLDTGIYLTGNQRALLWEKIQDTLDNPHDRPSRHAYKMAVSIGLPEAVRARFADDFEKANANDALVTFSAEDLASYHRRVEWLTERVHPITDFLAGAVLGYQAARRTNNPRLARWRQAPIGSQSGAFFDTTATPVSADAVLSDLHLPVVLNDTSVELAERRPQIDHVPPPVSSTPSVRPSQARSSVWRERVKHAGAVALSGVATLKVIGVVVAAKASAAAALCAVPVTHVVQQRVALDAMASVVRGDSLWKLSARWLGHSSRWRELLAANPAIGTPKHLQPGVIRLPFHLTVMPPHAPTITMISHPLTWWEHLIVHWSSPDSLMLVVSALMIMGSLAWLARQAYGARAAKRGDQGLRRSV